VVNSLYKKMVKQDKAHKKQKMKHKSKSTSKYRKLKCTIWQENYQK